jgi:DNA-binding CsgD family transcriptional regulator
VIRDVEILRYVAAGLSHKEIACRMSVGEKTTKTHVSNIISKLGIQRRTQAALFAVRNGLVDELPAQDVPANRSSGSDLATLRRAIGVLAGRTTRRRPAARQAPVIYSTTDRQTERFTDPALRHPA